MDSAALHQAIYTRLAGFTALTSKVVGVYSSVPEDANSGSDAAFPYIVFNQVSIAPFDTKSSDGASALVDVHAYTRTKSDLVLLAIADEIYNALHKFDLVIAGANTIAVGFENKVEFDDPDGKTIHTAMTFRVVYDDF
jgi:hypothetical protein